MPLLVLFPAGHSEFNVLGCRGYINSRMGESSLTLWLSDLNRAGGIGPGPGQRPERTAQRGQGPHLSKSVIPPLRAVDT